jgi:hypothetical protein
MHIKSKRNSLSNWDRVDCPTINEWGSVDQISLDRMFLCSLDQILGQFSLDQKSQIMIQSSEHASFHLIELFNLVPK